MPLAYSNDLRERVVLSVVSDGPVVRRLLFWGQCRLGGQMAATFSSDGERCCEADARLAAALADCTGARLDTRSYRREGGGAAVTGEGAG